MFLSWYRSTHKFIIFLYFMSMSLIAFNLIMTAALASSKVTDRPDQIGVYVGGGGDISSGRYIILGIIQVYIMIYLRIIVKQRGFTNPGVSQIAPSYLVRILVSLSCCAVIDSAKSDWARTSPLSMLRQQDDLFSIVAFLNLLCSCIRIDLGDELDTLVFWHYYCLKSAGRIVNSPFNCQISSIRIYPYASRSPTPSQISR
jgi:hypothetical protein